MPDRVDVGVGRPGRVAEEPLDRAAAEVLVVRRRQVEHAGLADDVGEAAAGRPPRWPGVRRRSARSRRPCPADDRQRVDRGADVGEGVGRAGAAAVLDRPGRPARARRGSAPAAGRTRCRTPASRNRRAPAPPRRAGHRTGSVSSAYCAGSSPYATFGFVDTDCSSSRRQAAAIPTTAGSTRRVRRRTAVVRRAADDCPRVTLTGNPAVLRRCNTQKSGSPVTGIPTPLSPAPPAASPSRPRAARRAGARTGRRRRARRRRSRRAR